MKINIVYPEIKPPKKVNIVTNHPVAYESYDHIEPHGTMQDNTKNPYFVNAILNKLGRNINYADLGCAGGGFVKQFYDVGVNVSVGIEGSDYSKKIKRAEWGTIPDNLFTADITKPFHFVDEKEELVKFDVISCYDVLEHIEEKDLIGLLDNLKNNLNPNGYFVSSIADWPHPGPNGNWHVTMKPLTWWIDLFKQNGFIEEVNFLQRHEYGRTASFEVTFKMENFS